MEELVYRGLASRYAQANGGKALVKSEAPQLTIAAIKKTLPKPVLERATYELRVIGEMGFNGYFLIIADFINWGKDKGIVFGPGRGSAAGSIIAYALKSPRLIP